MLFLVGVMNRFLPALSGLGLHIRLHRMSRKVLRDWGLPALTVVLLFLVYHFTVSEKLPNWWKDRFSSEMMPLSEAALRLYEVSRHSFLANFMEKHLSDTDSQMLNVFAAYIAQTKIPLFGKHPPSTVFEAVDKRLFPSTRFVGGGRELRYHTGQAKPEYVELSIRRKDLRKAIAEVRENSEALRKTEEQ
jgi:hypothetical protein